VAVKDPVQTWLKRFVLLVTAALLCGLSLLVWRLSVLVQRLDQSVVTLSSDVTNVTHAASDFTDMLLNPAQLVDELAPEQEPSINPVADAEIRYLMDCIGLPELRYQYGDDNRSAPWVQAKFWIKYRALSNDINSAEDFILKVASKTHSNKTYYIIQKNGNKTELSVFLTQALNKYRSQAAPQASSTPPAP